MRWPSRVLLVAVIFFVKVAAMSLAFSRSAFPRGWVAVLLFATAPVLQTTARAQTEMMPLPLQQHVHHAHGDSVVDKKTHHHTAPEKTKQSSPTKTPRENAPHKTQPATTPVTPSSVTAACTTSPTTSTVTYRHVKGFRVQVYTGFADRASRNAALQVEKTFVAAFRKSPPTFISSLRDGSVAWGILCAEKTLRTLHVSSAPHDSQAKRQLSLARSSIRQHTTLRSKYSRFALHSHNSLQ